MSRYVPGALFAAFTAATAATLAKGVGHALASGTAHAWLVACYWSLKTIVVAAFSYFMFVRRPSRRPSRDPAALAACAVAIVAVVALGRPGAGSTATLVAGESVALASCLWLLASVLALGRCFGVLPEARGLVTRGPYQIVRHPVYVGEFGTFAGFLLAAPTAWNLAVVVVFCVGQAVRMRLEEQALTLEFPEYADYAART